MRGCCSKYEECSNNRKCLYTEDPEYADCGYRKNLEAGRIFYGVNAGMGIAQPEPPKKVDKPQKNYRQNSSIYLHCFDRLFAIAAKEKEISRYLTPEQAQKIEDSFVDAGIPYKLQIDSQAECVIDYPTEADPSPANSRVVFEITGEEYHLLNYNTWLIKKSIADSIAKAFDNRYIKSRVELRGQYANIAKAAVNDIKNTLKIEVEDKRQVPKQDTKPVQMSFFDPASHPAQQPEPNRVIYLPPNFKSKKPDPGMPIGSIVIAKDFYWGTYRGELVDVYYKITSGIIDTPDIIMAKVKIIDMLEPPSQLSILTKTQHKRDPYPVGSTQVFYLDSCKQEVINDSLSATG